MSNGIEKSGHLIRAKMDHDLRSSLNVVVGYGAMLLEELPEASDSDTAQDLGYMVGAAREILHLNEQICDLDRLQDGTWKPVYSTINLDELLRTCRESLGQIYQNVSIIETNLDCSGAQADGDFLLQILKAIFLSQAKLSPPGTRFNLSAAEVDARMVIKIEMDFVESGEQEVSRALGRLCSIGTKVEEMEDIKDFDSFYISQLCRAAGVKLRLQDKTLTLVCCNS